MANTIKTARFNLETLEARVVLSSKVFDGTLTVYGTNAADKVNVVYSQGSYYVQENNVWTARYSVSSVWRNQVWFYGYGGNDYFANYNTNLETHAFGGTGNDSLYGSSNADYLYGEGGSDLLSGRGGNDELVAGDDYYSNTLFGGDGNDHMYGARGSDTLYGGIGNDWMQGGAGNDRLYGEAGLDWVYGEEGNDVLDGGADGSRDYMFGGTGADWLRVEYYWYNGQRYNREDFYVNSGEGDRTYA